MADYKHQNISPEALEDDNARAPRQTNAFNEKNYLNVKLAAGQNSKELKIRLLPIDKDSSSPFKTVWMHTVQVSPEISPKTPWKSYVCLNRTEDIDHDTLGNKCPFCELNHDAYENKVKAHEAKNEAEEARWKKISLENKPSEVCVMRCIERGAEDDGPKFWKVNVRTDLKDPKNIIKKLFKDRWQESIEVAKDENNGVLPEGFEPRNILDVETGRDLKVTIERVFDKEGKPTDKTTVSIVDYGNDKPLSNDAELMDKWINDEKVWSDVFVAKPYDYLSIVLEGGVPFYDKENHRWIPKIKQTAEQQEKKKEEEKKADDKIEAAKEKALAAASENNETEETEELPF